MDNKKHRYHTVNLPILLADKIGEVIASGEHGYTSLPDFIKEATRRYLRELGVPQISLNPVSQSTPEDGNF